MQIFKPSIKIGKKGDYGEFEHDTVGDVGRAAGAIQKLLRKYRVSRRSLEENALLMSKPEEDGQPASS